MSNPSETFIRKVRYWAHEDRFGSLAVVRHRIRQMSAFGFLAFGWGAISYSIWFGILWPMTAKYLLDALIYSLVVAGSFAWLWPAAIG